MFSLNRLNFQVTAQTDRSGDKPLAAAPSEGTLVQVSAEDVCAAARRNDTRALIRLLAPAPTPDLRDAWGMTPLMHAAHNNHGRLVRHLKQQGAQSELEDCAGMTAADWQAMHKAASTLGSVSRPVAYAAINKQYPPLLDKAAQAIRTGHKLLLETALARLGALDSRISQVELYPFDIAGGLFVSAYAELIHLALRQGTQKPDILSCVADWMGLRYLKSTAWRPILLRLLREPDCSPDMLLAARQTHADLQAVVDDETLADTVLMRQGPIGHIAALRRAGFTFEDDVYRRHRTLKIALAQPEPAYIVAALIALQQNGFDLSRILYFEGSRETRESIVGHLDDTSIGALAAAGLSLGTVGRGDKTLGHIAAGCEGWADLSSLLPALYAHGVEFNAADNTGSRPIAYLMRASGPIAEETAAMWRACGIDFSLPTRTRYIALPNMSDDVFQLECPNALALAAVYAQTDVVGYMMKNSICTTDKSISQAASLAQRFGHDALARRMMNCLSDRPLPAARARKA